MHTTRISNADRAALENLWGDAGGWAADTWTELNAAHFNGELRYHGIVWGLTPYGGRLGHTSTSGRITLHPALLDPQSKIGGSEPLLGVRYAADTLLHEMIHVALLAAGESKPAHNSDQWCAEIMRITPQLGLPPILAAPVNSRRIDGVVLRRPLKDHLSRADMAHWPHSIRPAGFYDRDGRLPVPV